MKLRHPEHVWMLLVLTLAFSMFALHLLGFLLKVPELYYWGRWVFGVTILVAWGPPLVAIVFVLFENHRERRKK